MAATLGTGGEQEMKKPSVGSSMGVAGGEGEEGDGCE